MKLSLSSKLKKAILVILVFLVFFSVVIAYDWLYSEDEDGGIFSEKSSGCNVAKINIYNDIYTYLQTDEDGADFVSSEDVIKEIRQADEDDNIKAILVAIDSYGGWPVAGEDIANALKQAKKPTVALIRSAGTSAAYLVSTGADRIIASKYSDIGSIGVTMSYTDNIKQNQTNGVGYNQLSAGKYKDMGDPNKPLTNEEKAIYLRDLKISHENFIKDVAQNRNLDVEKVMVLADGSSMMGEAALANGLIDQIGGFNEAEEYLEGVIEEMPEICW